MSEIEHIDETVFESFEKEYDLFSICVENVPLWERIRPSVFREIKRKKGRGQAHTQHGGGIKAHIQGFVLWMKNAFHKNPFFSNEHDFLFIGHQRRKLERDGDWWDIYFDPIHEQGDLDYVHMETPYLLSHRSPAKTDNLRYLELIEYGGTLQRKLGVHSPSVPDKAISRLEEAEKGINRRFDVNVDLVSKIQDTLHVRSTTLPLYKRLLDKINPEVVVIVVSYGKETLIEACKQKGIPVVELQHGAIYDHHFVYSYPETETKTTFPDYLFTFGEFWNENARYPIPSSHVIPVGYPYLEERLNTYGRVESSKQLLFISQGSIGRELTKFALKCHESEQIDHRVVYKLHPGEYDRWENEYPWLAESDIRVIDESEPPLYQLFAESSAQIGVGSTAVYEGICFGLSTFVFEASNTDPLEPLIEDGTASSIGSVEDLIASLGSKSEQNFRQERFFRPESVKNIISELKNIQQNR